MIKCIVFSKLNYNFSHCHYNKLKQIKQIQINSKLKQVTQIKV